MLRQEFHRPFLILCSAFALACGSSDEPDTSGDVGTDPGDPPDPSDPADPADPADNVDPETGLPYCPDDPSAYPEKCIDDRRAIVCKTDTGFAGDELALCDPAPDGFLVHYGPDDYDDPEQLAPFMIPAGADDERCMVVHTANTEDMLVDAYHARMRPNSHHLLVYAYEEDLVESTVPEPCTQAGSLGRRWLVGSQNPKTDVHFGSGDPSIEPDPTDPDYGVAVEIGANTSLSLDLHYLNPTNETILGEAWIQYTAADASEVQSLSDMIVFMNFEIHVPAGGSSVTNQKVCTADTDRYVTALQGHFHEHGDRFSAWKRDLDGNDTLVYETYSWAEPGDIGFRDGTVNPVPDAATRTTGGQSGYLHVKAGESIVFECAFDNPTEQDVGFGLAGKDQMCNLFGFYYPSDGAVWGCR